jgi:peptide/nickel transport system substrate-binding protein
MLCAFVLSGACAAAARDPDTVVLASGADLESANPLVTIHPLSRQVQRYALFVTLARLDSLLQPAPYLARGWSFDEERRTLSMNLETALRWHDGVPTTARDAAWTINAARDPRTGFPRAADLVGITGVNAPDDSTLTISFANAQPSFPPVLAELPILPAHLLRDVAPDSMRNTPFSFNPVGNGPFRFVERVRGKRWVFERNEEFPPRLGGPPRIRRFVIAVVDEATTKFAGLVSGELDLAGIAPTMADLVASDPRLRVLSYPGLLANGIVFNMQQPPFDDPRVRHAVSLSIDRQRLVDVAWAGFATASAAAVVADNPLGLAITSATDALAADSLLDAAGWTRGSDGIRSRAGSAFEFELLTVGSANNEVEQLIQADLAARGIAMRIRTAEFASFLAQARATPKTFDAIITGIPGDLSLAYLASMFDSSLAGSALDYSSYHTRTLDSLFARVRVAGDAPTLAAAWLSVQQELHRMLPVVWLYHSRGVQGMSARLSGVTMDLRGELVSIVEWSSAGGAR